MLLCGVNLSLFEKRYLFLRAASSPSCGDDFRGRAGFARAAGYSPTGPPHA